MKSLNITMFDSGGTKSAIRISLPYLFFFLALTGIIFLTSCNSNTIYEQNNDLENRIWLADSTLKFPFHISDTILSYDIYYNFRNTISYPFQNLYVTYNLKDAQGHVILTDLDNMDLFDPVTGEPFGKGLGDIYSHQFKAIQNYQFPDTGRYVIELQQFMRRDTLPEIITVGVAVKESPEEKD